MILVDLDVVQKREHHYRASEAVLDEIVRERAKGVLPAHSMTTVHYIVARYQSTSAADKVVGWLFPGFWW